MNRQNLKPLPNREGHQCFGCSSGNPYGLQMEFFSDNESLFSWLTVPNHLCGWDNLVHGGVLSTILDEIMGWTAIHFLKKFAFTRAMTIEFLKSVQIGEKIWAQASVLEVTGGKREAIVEGRLYKEEKTICAKSVGTFRLFTASAISRMGIMDEEMIKKFDFLIEP